MGGETFAPRQWDDNAIGSVHKGDPSHAFARSVGCPNYCWLLGIQLCETCGTKVKLVRQCAKVLKEYVNGLGQSYPAGVAGLVTLQSMLQSAVQPSCPWDGQGHGAKLSQQLLPVMDLRALCSWLDCIEEGQEPFLSVWW